MIIIFGFIGCGILIGTTLSFPSIWYGIIMIIFGNPFGSILTVIGSIYVAYKLGIRKGQTLVLK